MWQFTCTCKAMELVGVRVRACMWGWQGMGKTAENRMARRFMCASHADGQQLSIQDYVVNDVWRVLIVYIPCAAVTLHSQTLHVAADQHLRVLCL